MSIKLFVDAHVFDKEYQGTRTFIKGVYRALAAYSDIQIFIAANDVRNLEKEFDGLENMIFIQYKSKTTFIRLNYEVPLIIRKYKIDYAHFQYVAPFIKNCKFIVTTHDIIFCEQPQEFPLSYRLPRQFLFKLSAKRADILTTVSDHSKRSIQKHFRIKGQRISVICNGIAENFFTTYDKDFSKKYIACNYGLNKYILYVSRIEPRKNHAALLKAFTQLRLYEQGYHLVFLGKQSLKETELDKMILALPEKVKRHLFIDDSINDEGLMEFYRAADLFVYPSKAEGFGIPPLEAAALKVPVLCSRSTAMADFSFFNGEQFDPFNYEEIENKLSLALQITAREQRLNELSDLVREKYSWKKSAQVLYELIKTDYL